MRKKNNLSRRNFIKNVSAGLGVGMMGGGISQPSFPKKVEPVDKANRLPREVWIASISLDGLEGQKLDERTHYYF